MHGTHGNFLKTFWQLHNNIKIKPINDKGESFTDMDWWYNLENHKVLDNAEDFEILHIWHEYMTKWPSKFYYIDFKENIVPEIMVMLEHKHQLLSRPERAMEDLKKIMGDKLVEKIFKEKNYKTILQNLYYRSKEKFTNQPGIEKIDITELYNFDSFVNLLKKLNIYNVKNQAVIKSRWLQFYEKNKEFIVKIQNKYIDENK